MSWCNGWMDVKLCPRMLSDSESLTDVLLLYQSLSATDASFFLLALSMSGCTCKHSNDFFFSLLPWEEWHPIVSELCVSDGEVTAVYYSATAAHRRFSLKTLLRNSSGKCFQESIWFHCFHLSPPSFHLFPLPANPHLQTRLRGGKRGAREKAQNHQTCSDPLPTCVPSDPITSVQL